MTKNEAAERLRFLFSDDRPPTDRERGPLLDKALAAERLLERQATVERIRERLTEFGFAAQPQVLAILDEEAAR